MKKFEYIRLHGKFADDIFNNYGSRGWELVFMYSNDAVGGYDFIFKRGIE